MNIKATATLANGTKIVGRLTTDHPASSYNQPVFVDNQNQAYDLWDIVYISTASDMGEKGGKVTSEAKKAASRRNGKLGGRPKAEAGK